MMSDCVYARKFGPDSLDASAVTEEFRERLQTIGGTRDGVPRRALLPRPALGGIIVFVQPAFQ